MKVALRSVNGRFLCAEAGGDDAGTVHANRLALGPWETWDMMVLEEDPPLKGKREGLWRGVTDFRLAQRQMAGEDIRPLLEERKAVGATLVRTLGMKANNTGWDLIPHLRPDYWGDLRRYFDTLAAAKVECEWTVFADTRKVMPELAEQQDFWERTCEVIRAYPHAVELVNEWNHATQAIDPQLFRKPDGIWSSHGSGQTDADTVHPRWDYATYHARRDGVKAATNYDPYEFQAVFPQPCPLIADEGAKPQDYGFQVELAHLMGQHAAVGWGGTFHSDAGVDSRPFTAEERACARAFFEGMTT